MSIAFCAYLRFTWHFLTMLCQRSRQQDRFGVIHQWGISCFHFKNIGCCTYIEMTELSVAMFCKVLMSCVSLFISHCCTVFHENRSTSVLFTSSRDRFTTKISLRETRKIFRLRTVRFCLNFKYGESTHPYDLFDVSFFRLFEVY